MNREDIIRMALDCGYWAEKFVEKNCVGFERFFDAAFAAGAATEREAIAQMIEDAPPLVEFSQNDKGGCMVCGFTPKLASAAIRARSND